MSLGSRICENFKRTFIFIEWIIKIIRNEMTDKSIFSIFMFFFSFQKNLERRGNQKLLHSYLISIA